MKSAMPYKWKRDDLRTQQDEEGFNLMVNSDLRPNFSSTRSRAPRDVTVSMRTSRSPSAVTAPKEKSPQLGTERLSFIETGSRLKRRTSQLPNDLVVDDERTR